MARRTTPKKSESATTRLGPPLAAITEEAGVQSFEYASSMLDLIDSDQQHASSILEQENAFANLTEQVIAKLGDRPDLHTAVREYVDSKDFRDQFAHDVLTIATVAAIEEHRIQASSDPDRQEHMRQLNIAPRDDLHSDNDRAKARDVLQVVTMLARARLEGAYLGHVHAVILIGGGETAPRVIPLAAFSFNPQSNTLPFINAPHLHAVARAIWASEQPGTWPEEEFSPPTFLDTITGIKVSAHDAATYNPVGLDAAQQVVRGLDDKTLSTVLICIGKWLIDTSGHSEYIIPTRITVADVLGCWGLKKHPHGGYSKPQKEEARRQVLACNAIWVKTPMPPANAKGKTPIPRVRKSRLLEVSFEDQVDSNGGETPYAFHVAPGAWALAYLGKDRKVAHILKTVMQYNPVSERVLFRLGFYYATIWRNRAHNESYAEGISIDTILARSFIALPTHNPKRFIGQIEGAFDRLRKDGVIAEWRYEKQSVLPQKRYLEAWREWKVEVVPSSDIVEQYASIPERRRAALDRTMRARTAGQKRGKSA